VQSLRQKSHDFRYEAIFGVAQSAVAVFAEKDTRNFGSDVIPDRQFRT